MSIVDFQRYFAVCVDLGGDVDVDADVDVLKLRIHQRIDAHAADAGLERSRGDRDSVADFERSFLTIHRTNLRVLNQLGVAVAEQSAVKVAGEIVT